MSFADAVPDGPVNAVVPNPPQQKDFARELGRHLGKPAVLPAPGFVLRLVLGETDIHQQKSGTRRAEKKGGYRLSR